MKVFLAPCNTRLILKYGSYSFSFKQASISLDFKVIAHLCLTVSLSFMISRRHISLSTSSFWLSRSFSSSSSSSMAPLNAYDIFLHPLTICFLSSLSSTLASLYLANKLFSLLILWHSLLLISSNTPVLSLSLPASALSLSLLFLISINYLRWNMSSTLYITLRTISCKYYICWLDGIIRRGLWLGIVTWILSTVPSTLLAVLLCFLLGLIPNWF